MILPDAASSPRWENNDRPYLQEGLEAAGFEADIQNAQGDVNKYATIADQQLSKGCGVMLLVDYKGAGAAVAEKAKAEGIPVIAYDRPIEGADYYVSFDNVEVGRLEGQSIVDGLAAAGKDPATAVVVYMGGDPDRRQRQDVPRRRRRGHGGRRHQAGRRAAGRLGPGDKSATNFEQALTSLGGKVDAVWVANDTNAAGVITVLDKNGLVVPVSGQDAIVAGLQNVLLGKQTATVYKPVKLEADAAVELADRAAKGETPTADQELEDGTPYIAGHAAARRTRAGQATSSPPATPTPSDVCTADVAAKCEEFGVSRVTSPDRGPRRRRRRSRGLAPSAALATASATLRAADSVVERNGRHGRARSSS